MFLNVLTPSVWVLSIVLPIPRNKLLFYGIFGPIQLKRKNAVCHLWYFGLYCKISKWRSNPGKAPLWPHARVTNAQTPSHRQTGDVREASCSAARKAALVLLLSEQPEKETKGRKKRTNCALVSWLFANSWSITKTENSLGAV